MEFLAVDISFDIPLGFPLVREPVHGTGGGILGFENVVRL